MVKVSFETIKEALEEFTDYKKGLKSYLECFGNEFVKKYFCLQGIISQQVFRQKGNIDKKNKNFFFYDQEKEEFLMLVIKVLERQAEKEGKKLPLIPIEVAEQTIRELVDTVNHSTSYFLQHLDDLIQKNTDLAILLAVFQEMCTTKFEQFQMLFSVISFLKILDNIEVIERLEKMLKTK